MSATTTTASNPGAAPATPNGATSAPATGTSATEGGDLIAPGPYRARAIRNDKNVADHFGRSTTKKTMAVTIPFLISNMAKDGQPPSPYAFRTVRYTGFITDNTVERLIEGLKSAGTKIADDFGDLMQLNGLGSVECDVDVEIEEFTPDPTDEEPDPQPSRRNRIAWINPLGGRVFLESASAADLSGLGNMVKGLMGKAKASGGASSGGERVGKDKKLRDASGKVIY